MKMNVRSEDAAVSFEPLRPKLTRIAYRMLGSVHDAEDMVQEAFLAASQHFAEFRGSTELELTAWLRRILASSVAHLVRRYFGTQTRDIRLERVLEDEFDQSSRPFDRGLISPASSMKRVCMPYSRAFQVR